MLILECPYSSAIEENQEFFNCSPTLDDSFPDIPTFYPLHAITNTSVREMVCLRGIILNFPIHIFIDYGVVTNFLNPNIAHQLGLPISATMRFQFFTASGQTLAPSGEVHHMTVSIDDYQFTNSFLLLPVAGCDLVLGAQWLDTLGFIGWHFQEKVMIFFTQGRCHVLKDHSRLSPTLNTNDLLALLHFDHLDTLVSLPQPNLNSSFVILPPSIQALIDHYGELFSPPTSLPPPRSEAIASPCFQIQAPLMYGLIVTPILKKRSLKHKLMTCYPPASFTLVVVLTHPRYS